MGNQRWTNIFMLPGNIKYAVTAYVYASKGIKIATFFEKKKSGDEAELVQCPFKSLSGLLSKTSFQILALHGDSLFEIFTPSRGFSPGRI